MTSQKIFIFLFVSLLAISFVHADIIDPDTHPLNRCVKIVDANTNPDYVLISFVTGPIADSEKPTVVDSNTCLSKGYKFNSLKLYAFDKSYFNTVGIEGIKVGKQSVPGDCAGGCFMPAMTDEHAIQVTPNIEPYGGYVSDKDSRTKESIEYSIIGLENGTVNLAKTKQTTSYESLQGDKVEVFPFEHLPYKNKQIVNQEQNNQKVPEPTPKTESRGFWSNIGCFFKGLFGGSCA